MGRFVQGHLGIPRTEMEPAIRYSARPWEQQWNTRPERMRAPDLEIGRTRDYFKRRDSVSKALASRFGNDGRTLALGFDGYEFHAYHPSRATRASPPSNRLSKSKWNRCLNGSVGSGAPTGTARNLSRLGIDPVDVGAKVAAGRKLAIYPCPPSPVQYKVSRGRADLRDDRCFAPAPH